MGCIGLYRGVLSSTGMRWDEFRGHDGLRGGVLVYTGAHWAGPSRAAGALAFSVPAQKGKSRGAGAKSKPDKSRSSARAQGRQSKKTSPKSPRHTSAHHTPSPDEAAPAKEPLDVGPILNALLDRVLAECAVAAAARQVREPRSSRDLGRFGGGWQGLSSVSAAGPLHGVAGAGRHPICR